MTNTRQSNESPSIDANQLLVKLRRLLKGTLFVVISGIYTSLAAVLFLNHGWRTLLLAVFLLAIGQLLRYVLNDVDHVGWLLRTKDVRGSTCQAKRYQGVFLWLLFASIQVLNLGVVWHVYQISVSEVTASVLAGLIGVELIYGCIRTINRRIEFGPTSYGYSEGAIVPTSPNRSTPENYGQSEEWRAIDQKLEVLRKMAEQGEISKDAYDRVRDDQLIRRVLQN